jgi:Cdc6-like AAA superfamily ATPase
VKYDSKGVGRSNKLTNYKAYHEKHKVPFSLKGVPLVNRFVRRDAEMRELEEFFHRNKPCSTRRKVLLIYGLGGIGKTQLAIEFAREHQDRYSAVFWLNGSSKDMLQQSFVDIARRLPQDRANDEYYRRFAAFECQH